MSKEKDRLIVLLFCFPSLLHSADTLLQLAFSILLPSFTLPPLPSS